MTLAEYGYGQVVKSWQKIKPQAMRGWIHCSDGRWYHKTVAELALEAWKGQVRNREKVQKWREKKAGDNPGGNGSGKGNGPGTVPVTQPVRNRLKGESELESKRELRIEEDQDAAAAPPVAARERDGLALPAHLDGSVDKAFALRQAAANANGWLDAQFLNSTRRHALQCRLGECGGIDDWHTALEQAAEAEFLVGTDGRLQGWFHLDWLLNTDNFTRLMEGRYAERHASGGDQKPTSSSTVRALARLAAEGPG